MPAFRFEAIDTAGRAQKGVLDADSARSARAQLRTQGLTPLVVEPAGSAARGERSRRLSLGRKLSTREQAILTRQLASLLTAGLPLDEALAVLTDQAERDYIRELVAAIRASESRQNAHVTAALATRTSVATQAIVDTESSARRPLTPVTDKHSI